ncbi:MAG: arginase, partial [Cytophagaceae bacterium]
MGPFAGVQHNHFSIPQHLHKVHDAHGITLVPLKKRRASCRNGRARIDRKTVRYLTEEVDNIAFSSTRVTLFLENGVGDIISEPAIIPKSKLGVVWIDAHADLHTPYTTPSGNMHGMPLSLSINEDNIESAVHDLDPDTTKMWNSLKNLGKIAPKVLPEDIVFIALRDFEKEEKALIDKYGIKVISTKEVRSKGPENIVRSVTRYLSDCTDIYVSFDVDSLDSSISKGTGTPVSNG